jgi:hypothetical protein
LRRLGLAFRAFFAILFDGDLTDELKAALGLRAGSEPTPAPASAPTAPAFSTSDGALQMLAILQRDARLVDFFMEDISAYSDDQVGAAVRNLHSQCRETLGRYVGLEPVIDAVEGSYSKADGTDSSMIKFIGNVPGSGRAPGGILRHRGWRVTRVDLPALPPGQNVKVLAPAELEVE